MSDTLQRDELKTFLEETIRQIINGKGKHYVYGGEVEFDVAISKTTGKDGKLGVKVLEGNLSQTNERTSRVKFRIVLDEDEESYSVD